MKKGFSVLKGATAGASALAFPMIAFAAGASIGGILQQIKGLMDMGVPILVTLALLYFLWGLGEYIFEGTKDSAKRAEGRERMIFGILALFVMVSVWGLVGVIANTFNVGGGQINLPIVPTR